jgi:hypothetical protein
MKIIDIELFLGSCPFNPALSCDIDQVLEELSARNIFVGFVSAFEAIISCDNIGVNQNLIKQILPYSNILLPVITIDPTRTGWEETIKMFATDAVGIKLFPRYHRYDIIEPKLTECYEKLATAGKLIFISLRCFDDRFTPSSISIMPEIESEKLISLARLYPEVMFIFTGTTITEAFKLLCAELKNIYVTTSFLEGDESFEMLVSQDRYRQVLFGSYFPIFPLEAGIAKLKNQRISDIFRENIYAENILKLTKMGYLLDSSKYKR